jgi:hypothetical protein
VSTHDDDEWLNALAGRSTTTSATRREAEVLCSALRDTAGAWRDTAQDSLTGNEVGDARRAAALIDRAARDGLIERPRRRLASWQLPLAASVLVVLAVGLVFQLQPRLPASNTVRADERGIVRLTAADPARLKRDILTQLRAAGVEATGYEALDVHGIDADLALPLSPELERVLDAHRIPAPADGVLRIEIRRPE